ncbi:MAG: DNA replication/repair protein RecF [Gemmatimonadota bacterium]
MATVLQRIRLRQYRNFDELDLTFPAQGVAIIGENGSGKTNLLEAIYYLEIFRSFRGAPDDQLVHFGADVFHVRGELQFDERTLQIEAGYELRTRKKRVAVDTVEPERMADAIGRIGAVVFSPSDVAIIAGSPNERRRFIDIVLSVNQPGYLTALQRYRHLLKNRNAVLRSGRVDSALLEAWDEGLSETGARVMVARSHWVATHAASYTLKYSTISGGTRSAIRYAPGVRGLAELSDEATVRAAYRSELEKSAPRDRERGLTHAGPHRDDLGIVVEGGERDVDLREFGSGGQVRTAAIALRMIEAETIHAARGRDCLVLLDDVFAELDAPRSQRILELLEAEEKGQVILTAPKDSDVQLRGGRLESWRIAEGRIQT